MKTVRVSIVTTLLAVACVCAFPDTTPETSPSGTSWLAEPSFWIATAANLAGIGLFMSRVHAPGAAPIFGYATQAIGIPALTVAVVDLATGGADATTVGLLAYSAWALGAAFVDHVLGVNYRDPRKLGILIPYVVTYYAGIGLLSATQLSNGIAPWVIAGSTCILTVAASFYARAKGAD